MTNWYEEKLEARRDRFLARARKAAGEASSRERTARSMMEAIPFGQPILVGHHSEKRDRAFRGRMNSNFNKAHEARQMAEGYAYAADRVGTAGISSDDPEAIRKLKEKIARLEAVREAEKKCNAAMRKAAKAAKKKLGRELTKTDHIEIAENLDLGDLDPTWKAMLVHQARIFGWLPSFGNNTAANLRRYQKRLEAEEKAAAREDQPDIETDDYTVSEDREINRLQISFNGIPPENVRKFLKSNGFKWARSLGVWQRQLSNRAWYLAKVELPRVWETAAENA